MPFIPDSGWGVFYALSCFGVAAFSFTRQSLHARIVSLLFIAHWLGIRSIDITDHNNAALWVFHDAATVLVLSIYGWRTQSKLAFACAAVFFVVMLFDQYWLLFDSSFTANAAVAEAGGYLVFAMIAGAAIGHSNNGSGYSRHHHGSYSVENRRSISRHASVLGDGLASTQNHQEKGRGA
jgi:hypothetical protein